MPRDKHPRERLKRQLKRRKATKLPYERLLIVTEGSKTEPQYLEEIRIANRAASAFVRILPSALGTDPRQIVTYAKEKFLETRAFERVFAVFDRDQHAGYNDALNMAVALNESLRNDEGKPVPFIAIPSVPSFELWVLLHYQDLWEFADRHDIIPALRVHIPDYEKGQNGLYQKTSPLADEAFRRADLLRQRFTPYAGVDPYTDIDDLVRRLQNLRKKE